MTITAKARIAIERMIVADLIEHLSKAGFAVTCVWDGMDHHYPATTKEAIDAVFAVDEASLRFIKATERAAYDKERNVPSRPHIEEADNEDGISGKYSDAEHGVLLICGNGEDIISDYNFYTNDRDGFDKAMKAHEVDLPKMIERLVDHRDAAVAALKVAMNEGDDNTRIRYVRQVLREVGEVA